MIEQWIKEEMFKLYKYFIFAVCILGVVIIITVINFDVLPISIIISIFIVYSIVKKLPNQMYLLDIRKKYRDGTLQKYVNDHYNNNKTVYNNSRTKKNRNVITGSRMEVQYQTTKDLYNISKNYDRMKHLLALKKMLEQEKVNELD